jgi:hypothetical protein
MLRLLMLFVLLGASIAAPVTPQAAAQETRATFAVADVDDNHVVHFDVYYMVNHQWFLYGSYPYYYQAYNVAIYLQNLGYPAQILSHH